MKYVIDIDGGVWGKVRIDFSDEYRFSQMASPHTHEQWEIFCWLGSRMTYYLDGQSMRVPHSAVVPVPPGKAHRTHYDTDELRWKLDLSFEDRFFQIFPTEEVRTRIRAALSGGMLTVPVKWANELRRYVSEVFLPASDTNALAQTKAVFAVASILTGIAEAEGESKKQKGAVGMRHTHVAAAMEIIKKEYTKEITPGYLADRLHLTKTYLCHIFRDVLGMTVSECVRSCRIQEARTLLLDPTLSVAEVSERVGYASVTYFTKSFRAEEGTTPSEYRRIVLGRKKS